LCFETAHRIAEGLELPLDVALLDLADGRRLRQAGKRGEAIVRLRTARTGFERLGAEPYATASSRELERCGDASGGRASQARHGLTPAELGVARLVASGKSNREAADDLFVTVKTVEFHLRSVFAKLGITSRQQIQSRLGAAESD
jgi:DNA-binding CsgD family transcriptional regulator